MYKLCTVCALHGHCVNGIAHNSYLQPKKQPAYNFTVGGVHFQGQMPTMQQYLDPFGPISSTQPAAMDSHVVLMRLAMHAYVLCVAGFCVYCMERARPAEVYRAYQWA